MKVKFLCFFFSPEMQVDIIIFYSCPLLVFYGLQFMAYVLEFQISYRTELLVVGSGSGVEVTWIYQYLFTLTSILSILQYNGGRFAPILIYYSAYADFTALLVSGFCFKYKQFPTGWLVYNYILTFTSVYSIFCYCLF